MAETNLLFCIVSGKKSDIIYKAKFTKKKRGRENEAKNHGGGIGFAYAVFRLQQK